MSDQSGLGQLQLSGHLFKAGRSDHQFVATAEDSNTEKNDRKAIGIASSTLDHLVAQGDVAMPTAIKIDVDGIELRVLRGMSKVLTNPTVTNIVCELPTGPENENAVREMLSEYGFQNDPEFSTATRNLYLVRSP